MKKFLLLAVSAILAVSSYGKVKDETVYENQGGLECRNIWVKSKNADEKFSVNEFASLPFVAANYARTALVLEKTVYVAESKPTVVDEKSYNYATLHEFDLETGDYVKAITLTSDGAPVQSPSPLCFNQIGIDSYGHVYGCGYTANAANTPLRPFVINLETGAVTYVGEALLPEAEADATGRIDYIDVVGDITGEAADGVLMAAPSGANNIYAYRWRKAQGETEWKGDFDDFVSLPLTESYPAERTTWQGAVVTKIVADEDNTGEQFYIDDMNSCPVLYNSEGGAVDGFQNATSLAPTLGANGVEEFELAGKPMIAWVHNQYVADETETDGCKIRVGELGEGMTFENLQVYWTLPKEGLGMTSDVGTRIHNIGSYKFKDENGKEGILLLTYKNMNGLAVYLIGEEGIEYTEKEGSVEGVSSDNAKVVGESYYNVLGQKVANPVAGQVYVKVANLSNGATKSTKVVK